MVGTVGFEPTTYGTQNRRATRLRYAPPCDASSNDTLAEWKPPIDVF